MSEDWRKKVKEKAKRITEGSPIQYIPGTAAKSYKPNKERWMCSDDPYINTMKELIEAATRPKYRFSLFCSKSSNKQ